MQSLVPDGAGWAIYLLAKICISFKWLDLEWPGSVGPQFHINLSARKVLSINYNCVYIS